MTLNEYQQATARTCPDLGSEKLNIAHMIMGMISEITELSEAVKKGDIINIGEELTDIHWYLSNYCRMYNIKYERLEWKIIESDNFEEPYKMLVEAISKLTDIEKKFIAYNKAVNEERRFDFCNHIFLNLKDLYLYFKFDVSQCMENNINKLKIRFPDKFSEENAINRNLEAERVELEK